MSPSNMLVWAAAVGIVGVAAQSVKSCGSESDHLKQVSIKLNPDPPVKGQQFSMELSGELDEDITGGSLDVDLAVTALKFIKSNVKQQLPFTYEPGWKQGPMKITIGPTQLPSSPGGVSVQGQVHVKDGKGDAVACVDINLKMGSEGAETSAADHSSPALDELQGPHVTSVESCTKPADHLKNFNINVDGGSVNMTGNLDESLEALKLNLDIKVKKFFIHIPLKMSIPISLSPAIPSGAFQFAAGPATGRITPDPKVTIVGQIVGGDSKDEEVFCLNVNQVLGAGIAGPEDTSLRSEFEQFVLDQQRNYGGAEEWEMRFEVFKTNVLHYRKENTKNHSYIFGINRFTDRTPTEFASMQKLKVMPWEERASSNGYLGDYKAIEGLATPTAIDWVSQGAVTPVKDQGGCGSCWAFSTTGALEGAWQVATGRLISLSEQQLVDCFHGSDGCGGGFAPDAIPWEEDRDVCTELSYPYTAQDGSCQSSGCSAGIPRHGVIGVQWVQKNDNALMQAVAGRPISVAVDANPWQGYNSGVFTGCDSDNLNHGVLLVGYGRDYWKIKNSWGTGWGEAGYIRLERSGDPCGILDQAVYAVVAGGPSPPTPPPGPSPPTPPPSPPGPGSECRYNDDCPPGEDCYHLHAGDTHGICSSSPPLKRASSINATIVV